MKTCSAITIALAIAMFAPTSHAQPSSSAPTGASADRTKEAETHFRRGLELYKEGDTGAALVEFKRAYELAPNYRALYNLGETYFQLQRYADALKTLQAYLNSGGAQIPAEKRAAVEDEVRQLQNRIGQVDVKVNVDGVQVLVDNELVGTSPLTQPVFVSIGHRRISVSKSGVPTQERFVDVAAGDHASVSFEFAAIESTPTKLPPTRAAASGVAAARPEASAPHAGTWIAWGIAGALGAATAVTSVLTLTANRDLSNQLDTFPGNATGISDARNNVKTFGIATDVLIGTTVAAAGVAVYVSLSTHSQHASAEVGVGPSSLLLRGRF